MSRKQSQIIEHMKSHENVTHFQKNGDQQVPTPR